MWFLTMVCFSCPLTRGKFPNGTKNVVCSNGVFFLPSDTWEVPCRTKNLASNSGVRIWVEMRHGCCATGGSLHIACSITLFPGT
jgi:hypothetical protein